MQPFNGKDIRLLANEFSSESYCVPCIYIYMYVLFSWRGLTVWSQGETVLLLPCCFYVLCDEGMKAILFVVIYIYFPSSGHWEKLLVAPTWLYCLPN